MNERNNAMSKDTTSRPTCRREPRLARGWLRPALLAVVLLASVAGASPALAGKRKTSGACPEPPGSLAAEERRQIEARVDATVEAINTGVGLGGSTGSSVAYEVSGFTQDEYARAWLGYSMCRQRESGLISAEQYSRFLDVNGLGTGTPGGDKPSGTGPPTSGSAATVAASGAPSSPAPATAPSYLGTWIMTGRVTYDNCPKADPTWASTWILTVTRAANGVRVGH